MVLWLILAVLLFGSGAVLGFFSALFWTIVILVMIALVIWILIRTPRVAKEVTQELIEEQKVEYRKRPLKVIFTYIFFIIIIAFWLLSKLSNNSIETGSTELYGQNQDKKLFDSQSIKGYSYPEVNRNVFLQNCVKEAGQELAGISQAYCSCALNYLESNYSFKEFIKIEQAYSKTNQIPQPMSDAMQYCVK